MVSFTNVKDVCLHNKAPSLFYENDKAGVKRLEIVGLSFH